MRLFHFVERDNGNVGHVTERRTVRQSLYDERPAWTDAVAVRFLLHHSNHTLSRQEIKSLTKLVRSKKSFA